MRVGDYAIDSELERENNRVVYQATHLVLPRRVELNVLADPRDRSSAIQLLREACLLEALQHPGIPRVFECGVLADRRPWIAVQRIDGQSLAKSLATGPMAIADVVVLLRDVADVLHHAHARGVVHRRLTAETLVRTAARPSSVCLRSWSDARAVESTLHADVRDDVYALGAVAFHALTGCLHTRSVSATEWFPSAPSELTALIDSMLDEDARARPTSEEARERARWLATTVEPLMIGEPRWTPTHGLDPDTHERVRAKSPSPFSIRIRVGAG